MGTGELQKSQEVGEMGRSVDAPEPLSPVAWRSWSIDQYPR